MFNDFLAKNINAVYGNKIPKMVQVGFGQVEPNHLSAQRTSQVYAQLPAARTIDLLQQGQFVKYNYAKGQVDFDSTAPGEWMLVYNEIKLYRDFQNDCEFAMIKDNYQARIYSPFGGAKGNQNVGIYGVQHGTDFANTDIGMMKQSRYYNGDGPVDAQGNPLPVNGIVVEDRKVKFGTKDENTGKYQYEFPIDDVTANPDMYEMHYNEDPYHIYGLGQELRMPEGTNMVPRVLKTNVGDIFTTNTVDALITDPAITVGGILVPRTTDGILVPESFANADTACGMKWQIAKIYTMPDHQPGVKVMRVQ